MSSLADEVAVSIDATAARSTGPVRTIGPLPRCYPSTNIMLSHFLVTSLMHAQRHNNRSTGWFARVQMECAEGINSLDPQDHGYMANLYSLLHVSPDDGADGLRAAMS